MLLTLQSKLMLVQKQLPGISTSWATMVELLEMKPLLRPANIKRRNDWARDMMEWPQTFWVNAIFPDESRFASFSSSGTVWVWRLPNKEFELKRLHPTVRHGFFSVMVWSTIRSDRRSALVECEGNVNNC